MAIVGVGHTVQGEHPGKSAEQLNVEAIEVALADSGISKSDVDGLITCKSVQGDGTDVAVGAQLGLNPRFAQSLDYGTCNFSLHLAVMAIMAGLAETIVLSYGANARTGRFDFTGGRPDAGTARPAGLLHIAGPAGLALQRHKYLYGTTDEQFGWIAVAQREWAQMNPVAIFRDPMTMDDYLAEPYMVEPLRRQDVTMISDGGVAVVVTARDRVSQFATTPVYIIGMAERTDLRSYQNNANLTRPWLASVADDIWGKTGLGPSDIDVLYIQDPSALWVLQMLEYYGFCAIGEAGPFLAEGHTRPGGSRPLNTNGGQLSESYAWGWLHICEAVRQLRGEAGERQISGAEVAMYCSTMSFVKGAASILSLHPS
ncbi:MAG TPA: thiolase family protein [Acidimicrobiales bacterium]|nr:thiolase family protein [Acidimicrobiales bacterium]